MFRFPVLGVLGLMVFPTAAAAQFMPAYVPPNPLYQHPAYRFQFNLGTTVPTTYGRAFFGVTVPFTRAPQLFSPNYGMSQSYPWSGTAVHNSSGYLTGGSGSYYMAQRDFDKAQRDAAKKWGDPEAAKNMISNQWVYERVGNAGLPGTEPGKPPADALIKALTSTDESDLASGEALNQILQSISSAEQKGAKGVSAYLSPQLLDSVRYSGGPADTLNLVRQSGRLQFPTAFDAPELSDLRDQLDKDLTAVSTPILAGKPLDSAKLMKLELTLSRLETASAPVVRNLSFEDAIAVRKFLNQFANAVRSMKTGVTGLVNPAWASEGTNVADLVKLMTKQKLQFGPAPRGSEDAYVVLHKALTTYLFVLTQPKK